MLKSNCGPFRGRMLLTIFSVDWNDFIMLDDLTNAYLVIGKF